MEHYIYIHTRRSDGTVFYVGKGQKTQKGNPYARAHAYGKNSRSVFWHRYVAKHGPRDVTIDSVWATEAEAYTREVELIALHRRRCDGGTLVNHALGGPGSESSPRTGKATGRVYGPLSQETKDRISRAKKGAKTSRVYAPLSDETKAKLSAKNRGRVLGPCSEQRRKRVSEANRGQVSWAKGTTKSDETRERMRQAQARRWAHLRP